MITYLGQMYHHFRTKKPANALQRASQPSRESGYYPSTKTCANCGLPLSGQTVEACNKQYHLNCFGCSGINVFVLLLTVKVVVRN